MKALIKQLTSLTAGRYHIIASPTRDGMQLECLDLANNLVASRSLSASQLQNGVLLTTVFVDLKSRLGY